MLQVYRKSILEQMQYRCAVNIEPSVHSIEKKNNCDSQLKVLKKKIEKNSEVYYSSCNIYNDKNSNNV